MRETKQKQIGSRGFTYHATQFGSRQGGRVLVRLLKMIGGAAGEAIKGEAEGEKGLDMATVGAMVANLATTASEKDFDYLCDTFITATSVSREGSGVLLPLSDEGVFDLHFAGEYIELGQWLLFCIETNFGGFLGEGGIVQRIKAGATARRASQDPEPAKSKSRSPNTSAQSGISGA